MRHRRRHGKPNFSYAPSGHAHAPLSSVLDPGVEGDATPTLTLVAAAIETQARPKAPTHGPNREPDGDGRAALNEPAPRKLLSMKHAAGW